MHHSVHTGLDIRSVLRHQQSMFGDSLLPREKNIAPSFNGGGGASRPRSRPSDISFEAGVEHEARLQAAHGRRAAQRDAYIAAGANPQQPTSFHQVAAVSRHQKRTGGVATAPSAAAVEDPASWQALLASDSGGVGSYQQPAPRVSAVNSRGVPAGRGLSREGSARASRGGLGEGGVPGGSSGFAVAEMDGEFGLSGLSLSATAPPRANGGAGTMLNGGRRGGGTASAAAAGGISSGGGGVSNHHGQPAGPKDNGRASPAYVLAEPVEAPDGGTSVAAPPPAPSGSPSASPTKMTRAREWSHAAEDAYRLQEAGYRDEREALSLGHPPIERWPEPVGFIRKLVTRETLTKGGDKHSILYFSKKRECEDKLLNSVKLFTYS